MSRAPHRAILTAAIAAIAVAAHIASVWGFTIDDAFIIQRYADRISEGRGWTMNDGAWTDGVTGPLFGVLLAAARLASIDGLLAAKAIGAASAALAAALTVHALARRATGLASSSAAAAMIAGASAYCVWAVGGLETGVAALALVAAIEGTVARPLRWSWIVAGALAVPWLRPECVPPLLVAALVVARWRPRAAAVLGGTSIASTLALVVVRLVAFGHALPLSARAKPAELAVGLDYILRALLATTSGVGIVLVVAACFARRDDRTRAATFVALVVAVTVAGGDWMPSWRLLVPALPLFAGAAAAGAVVLARALGRHLRRRGRRFGRRVARRPALAVCLGAALAVLVVPVLERAAIDDPIEGAIHARAATADGIARWLTEHARVVAMVDVGYLAYVSRLEVVDLGGLTDPRIADAPGGYLTKRIDPAYLAERNPDVVVLHSTSPPRVDDDGRLVTLPGAFTVERTVAQMSWLVRRYRVARVTAYSPDYHYVMLVRR